MRYAENEARDQAIGSTLTTLFDNLGNRGTENFTRNQVISNQSLPYISGVIPGALGYSQYYGTGMPSIISTKDPSQKYGGMITKKTNKRRK